MRLTRILNSKRGNSMLSVMGAISVLGAIAFYSSQSLINRVKFSRGLATKTEFSNHVDYIHLVFSSPEACRLNFENKIIDTTNTGFQTNTSFAESTFVLLVPGILAGQTKKLAKVGDVFGDMNLTEMKFRVEGNLGSNTLSASLNFKLAKPSAAPSAGGVPQSRSSGTSEKLQRLMLSVVTAPTANPNEVIITDCTTNQALLATPSPSVAPLLGQWTATGTIETVNTSRNALRHRQGHTAVWTGSRMLVWGGYLLNSAMVKQFINRGSIYDLQTDTWRAMGIPTGNATYGRTDHVAFWTGSKMLVLGGSVGGGFLYDPVTESYTDIASAPTGTLGHLNTADGGSGAAVWTGTQLILWAGTGPGGSTYDPVTNTWASLSQTDGPSRFNPTAVWTGSKMIVWGGTTGQPWLNPGVPDNRSYGGIYDPMTDTWAPISSTNQPSYRHRHAAAWVNGKMIIWGGLSSTTGGLALPDGALYDPASDSWSPVAAFDPGYFHGDAPVALSTGSQMILFQLATLAYPFGGMYIGPPLPRKGAGVHSAANVGIYDPASNTWTTVSERYRPPQAFNYSAVWTGSNAILWGGMVPLPNSSNFIEANTGGIFTP